MAGYQVYYTIPNIDLWHERFIAAPEKAVAAMNKALQESAVIVQGAARQEAPVRTSRLRDSIMKKVEPLRAIVFTSVDYAEYVERGTGLYGPYKERIVPKNAKVLATKTNPGWGQKNKKGYYIIGKSTKGQKANPFMERAYEGSKAEVIAAFSRANKEFLASLGGK